MLTRQRQAAIPQPLARDVMIAKYIPPTATAGGQDHGGNYELREEGEVYDEIYEEDYVDYYEPASQRVGRMCPIFPLII